MSMIKNQQKFTFGMLYSVVGISFTFSAYSYKLGTAARMDAGYFPFYLGIILTLLGCLSIVRACLKREPRLTLDKLDWRSLVWMTGAVLLFALAVQLAGLIAALILLVVISSAASHEFTWKGTLGNTAILLLLNLGIFVYGLELPFNLWPTFLGS